MAASGDSVDVVVIGAGMLGSSAAKYLAEMGADTVLVGQPEPVEKATHSGVFASHYDTARIVRVIDRSPFYAKISHRSIMRFVELEKRTGVEFYFPVGHLSVSPVAEYVSGLREQAAEYKLEADDLDDDGLAAHFPYLRFADGIQAVLERGSGGYIDPRAFIEAQRVALSQANGRYVSGLVRSVDCLSPEVQVHLADGSSMSARSALIATGAFANHVQAVPRAVDFAVSEHTVVFAELHGDDAALLSSMPSIIYKRGDEVGESVYVTPPIKDAHGRFWIKIGQSTGHKMSDPARDLIPWFQSSGDSEIGQWLIEELTGLLPGMKLSSIYSDSCVVSQSPTKMPFIDRFEGTNVYGLLAGNGQVAKSADELGRVAASRLLVGAVPTEYEGEDFTLRHQ